MITRKAFMVLLGIGISLGGCAYRGSPPYPQWDAADAIVLRAQSSGAIQVPDARLHLILAAEDLQQARGLMGIDNARSTTLCLAAAAEAQLAVSLSRNPRALQAAPAAAGELQWAPGTARAP